MIVNVHFVNPLRIIFVRCGDKESFEVGIRNKRFYLKR